MVAAHGTRSAAGRAVVADLVAAVGAKRPGLDVRLAFVDVVEPFLADVVAAVPGPLIVVPALLSRGFHVRVDIPSALASRDDARATAPLGPDRAVSVALADRLTTARRPGASAAPNVVLVATGSSDPDAAEDLQAAAADLARLLDRPVRVGVMSGPGEDFSAVIARAGPQDVDVVPYLLADGVFLDRLRREVAEDVVGENMVGENVAGEDMVGENVVGERVRTVGGPIGAHPAVVGLILDRYDRALAAVAESTGGDGR